MVFDGGLTKSMHCIVPCESRGVMGVPQWFNLNMLCSSIGDSLAPFQDGRHGSKMAAMVPIQDGV